MKTAVEDNIARAMATFIPDLKREYQDFVRRTLDRAKADLGPNLSGVYSSRSWHRIFRGTLSPNVKRDHPADYRYTGIPSKEDRYAYIIDEGRLEKNSQEYAEGTAYQWYGKMVSKLGSLDSVDIKYMQGGNLILTGNRGSIEIRIDQQRIFKTSSLGTPFHQWPARIYVNGKFTTEREYKKKVLMMSLRAIDQEKEPKRPPIDPMSRPRTFHFEYKVDRVPGTYGKEAPGEVQRDYAKGMTEQEAWDKLQKREMRSGYFEKVYDPRVASIRAWNGVLLWKAGENEQARRSNSETDDKSKSNLRGGLQRTEHVRVPRVLPKGKQGRSRSRPRHGKETGGILEVH